jgi:hypothetical protein
MNRAVWMLAAWLVKKHDTEAPYAVHARIMAMRRARVEHELIAFWFLVDDAVRDWGRTSPGSADTVH